MVSEQPVSLPPPPKSFDFGPPPPAFENKEAERQHVKERLALAYRVLAREGMCEGASGHLTSRDPIDPTCFWVNPYGLHFSLMTASALLLVSHSGNVLSGGLPGRKTYNQAAFVIHSAIHAARPEVNSVVHAHSPNGKAWSTLGRDLPFYTQDSAVFYGDIGRYETHGGVVLDDAEAEAIIGAIGDKKAVVMQSHGILTVGGCIESAISWFYLLEKELGCILKAEAAAAMTGKRPLEIAPDVAEFTWRETGSEEAGRFEGMPLFEVTEIECDGRHKSQMRN